MISRLADLRLFCLLICCLISGVDSAAAQLVTRGGKVPSTLPLGSEPGDPTYDLPAGMRLISAFGERPAFSPDGRKIAFIGRSYGDAFEYDLATGRTRNLTSHAPHEGFLRVHYLRDGSYLLLGPHLPGKTREETRSARIELFWMDAAASRPPVPLKTKVWEGIAVSPESNLIAWSVLSLPRKQGDAASTTVRTGRVVVGNGTARLEGIADLITKTDCLVEAQDFLPGDRALTMPCYGLGTSPSNPRTEVLSVDLRTKKLTRYPITEGLYGEVEGIFPDGRRTLVECAQDRTAGMDLCVLDLDPARPTYTRMTDIVRYGRWKFGNPVVRRDGRMIAAQVGPADVPDAGVGQGIVVMDLAPDF